MRSSKPNRVDRWQVVTNRGPALAAVFAQVQVSGCRAEGDVVVTVIERVAINNIERAFLRQAFALLLPACSAVVGASHEEAAVDRHALCVRAPGYDPCDSAVVGIDGDGKSEVHALAGRADLAPGLRAVVAVEHTDVILLPDVIGRTATQLDDVRIVTPLRFRVG